MRFLRRHRRKILGLALFVAAFPAAHLAIGLASRATPPRITMPTLERRSEGPVTFVGKGSYRRDRGLHEVVLEGGPEELGAQHAALLYDRMVDNERDLWEGFASIVPFAPARVAMFDLGRLRHRGVDREFPGVRRRELAAQALAFSPDPYEGRLPTYERMAFLHALYDISLGFERSPLLGCSVFGLGPAATRDGHTLVARAFDFDAADVFDTDKAVFFVKGQGVLPFASVAWPGLVGVLTGMNSEGVFVSVNGARARDPRATGMPVIFALREVLERARSTDEAVAVLSGQEIMVSHLVFVADARGAFAVVERAPGAPAHTRRTFADPARVPLTNHFEGPLAEDPRDARVRRSSSTLARRARLDEMLSAVSDGGATPESVLAMLRDHGCARGEAGCALGDRRAIDALIATHGVVADTSARILWVSRGPHLAGAFVGFDLGAIFSTNAPASGVVQPRDLPPDLLLHDTAAWNEGRRRAGGPLLAPRKK